MRRLYDRDTWRPRAQWRVRERADAGRKQMTRFMSQAPCVARVVCLLSRHFPDDPLGWCDASILPCSGS